MGVRTATGMKEEERERKQVGVKRENERGTRYLAPTVRAVNSTPAD